MKNKGLSDNTKIILYPLIYWAVFIALLILGRVSGQGGGKFFVLFPFLFIVVYNISPLKNKTERVNFILFGFIFPFLVLLAIGWYGMSLTFFK